MSLHQPTRRYFTEAARVAAAEARRRMKNEARPLGTPAVYVVRQADAHLLFGWEIRRFGGVLLRKGDVGYATPDAARSAGVRALSDAMVLA